ncbi:MAG: flagellar protein FlbD [Lachnospiraceae bacterium]|nr:flagellar protein FlbD [Lachnospiraceae bacterium]
MINLTRMNDSTYTLNCELIEMIEETPDTVITLTSGKKFVVKESRSDIVRLVEEYKRRIFLGNTIN